MNKRNRLFMLVTLVAPLVLAACEGTAAPTAVVPANPTATAAGATVPTVIAPANPTATAAGAAAPTAVVPANPTATAAGAETAPPTVVAPANPTTAVAGALPVFSKPTDITNRYFPVSSIDQTVSLGTEGGERAREEVTLLPDVKTISWAGGNTQVRVAQFVGYGDGKLVEVAYDYFAQADN